MKKKTSTTGRTAAKKSTASSPAPKLEVSIDYPLEGETVQAGHYAIRISAPEAAEVEASTADGAWQPCRGAVGYFWCDWNPDQPGGRRIEARARVGKGRWVKADRRNCLVISEAPSGLE